MEAKTKCVVFKLFKDFMYLKFKRQHAGMRATAATVGEIK